MNIHEYWIFDNEMVSLQLLASDLAFMQIVPCLERNRKSHFKKILLPPQKVKLLMIRMQSLYFTKFFISSIFFVFMVFIFFGERNLLSFTLFKKYKYLTLQKKNFML